MGFFSLRKEITPSKNQLCTSHDSFLYFCMLLFENVYLVITVYYGKYIPIPSPLSRRRMDGDHVATDLGRLRGPCLERKESPHGGYYHLKRPIKAGALRSLIMVRISGHETECSRTRQTKDFYSETFLIQPILKFDARHHRIFFGGPCFIMRHNAISQTTAWKSGI